MARKSPRSRRRAAPASTLPKKRRARATPGARGNGAVPALPRARHATSGARALARVKGHGAARNKTHAAKPRRRRFAPPEPERVTAILSILARLYPEATTALHFKSPFQLLVATILSAQCTDERVNQVTPALFQRYPDAKAFASARRDDLEAMIRSTGFFRNKAKAIMSCAQDIVTQHGGEVPRTLEELTALHGVGRKTANVVLGNAFDIPGLVVDTHVGRVSRRLGLTDQTDPVKVEHAVMEIVPRQNWTLFSHWLILHGRRVCIARKPRCSICPLLPHCPQVGVTVSQ
jgi:endonuclease-3